MTVIFKHSYFIHNEWNNYELSFTSLTDAVYYYILIGNQKIVASVNELLMIVL